MYATPRGTKSLKTNGPDATADVVRKLTSPENGVAVKKEAARVAALSKARPKMDGLPGTDCPDAASAIETTSPSCLSTLRLMWRRRHAVSLWFSPSGVGLSPDGSDTPAVRMG